MARVCRGMLYRRLVEVTYAQIKSRQREKELKEVMISLTKI